MQKKKWTKKTCAKAASECLTRGSFSKKHSRAYRVALEKGWLDGYSWFLDGNEERKRRHSIATSRECLKAARKFSSVKDFRRGCPKMYSLAKRNGYVSDYLWLSRPRTKLTEETCRKEAEKYSTLLGFIKGSPQHYHKARIFGWVDKFTWLKRERKVKGYWTYENCRKEAENYKTQRGFRKGCASAFLISGRNGWLKDFGWLEKLTPGRKRGQRT